jgi:hypothetical protein
LNFCPQFFKYVSAEVSNFFYNLEDYFRQNFRKMEIRGGKCGKNIERSAYRGKQNLIKEGEKCYFAVEWLNQLS